jgi:hypothetical protein
MKVAYVFTSPRAASYKVGQMILPQLEAGTHGVEVVGIGERLSKVAADTGMLLMMCDMCALERNLAEGAPRWCDPATGRGRTEPHECTPLGTVEGTQVGCFPDLYAALAGNPPDHVITL